MNKYTEEQITTLKTIQISGKTSDSFSLRGVNAAGEIIEYQGYVPSIGIGSGDYIKLEIDLATGQILNWKKPSAETLTNVFSEIIKEDGEFNDGDDYENDY